MTGQPVPISNASQTVLHEHDLQVNNVLSSPYSGTVFIIEDAITLTTVYRAKGNEAAVVFAAGIDALFPLRRSRLGRNRLFTAFTRAKGWLRVSGTGPGADPFLREIEQAIQNVPRSSLHLSRSGGG